MSCRGPLSRRVYTMRAYSRSRVYTFDNATYAAAARVYIVRDYSVNRPENAKESSEE